MNPPPNSKFRILCSRLRSGQSLVEALVAISILIVGFLGVVTLLSQSLRASKFASNDYVATYLAAEGVEIVKNVIDANVMQRDSWDCGVGMIGTPVDYEVVYNSVSGFGQCPGQALGPFAGRTLSYNAAFNLYDYSGGASVTGFVRRIRITRTSGNEIQVNSIVSWNTGLAQLSINLEDHFYNWRP